jgi:hypothetical protein
MSLSAIASQLYTIQTRKKIPLSTAFKLMVREDLAMRFSVYNLARTLTKSEFIATVAQASFGQRTPLQKKQDEEESKKEKRDKQFKQFSALSIANLNKKINTLAMITERNTALISGIYGELGSFRTQRRMNINSFTDRAVRVPGLSRTIKGQIEQINAELQQLKVKERRGKVRGVTAKAKEKKEKEKSETDFFKLFLPLLLKNPTALALLAGGALRSIGIARLGIAAYALYNLPGAMQRMGTRMGGKTAYDDPITEATSQTVDPYIAGYGAYQATKMVGGAISMLRDRGKAGLKPVTASQARIQMINKMIPGFQKRGMGYREAQKTAGQRVAKYSKAVNQAKKFKVVAPLLRGLIQRFPAVNAAVVTYHLSKMSIAVSNRSSGLISQDKFREEMISGYDGLIDSVGVTGVGMLMGGLVGTAMFPGVGTVGGAILGGTFATFAHLISELFGGKDSKYLATKVYGIIHEDKTERVTPKKEVPPDETDNRDTDPTDAERGNTDPTDADRRSGRRPDRLSWMKDTEFLQEVYRVSDKFKIDPQDLLKVMHIETGGTFDPAIPNPTPGSTATGLIQMTEANAKTLGTTTSKLKMMTRAEQMTYVEKYFDFWKLPKGANRATIYAYVFAPAKAQRGDTVFYRLGDREYDINRALDVAGEKNAIDMDDLDHHTNRPNFPIPENPRVELPPEEELPVTSNVTNEEDTTMLAMSAIQGVETLSKRLDLFGRETRNAIVGLGNDALSNRRNPSAFNPEFPYEMNRV